METGEKDNNPINFNKEKTFQRQINALKKNMSGSWNSENCVHLISVQVASKNDIQLKYGNFDEKGNRKGLENNSTTWQKHQLIKLMK